MLSEQHVPSQRLAFSLGKDDGFDRALREPLEDDGDDSELRGLFPPATMEGSSEQRGRRRKEQSREQIWRIRRERERESKEQIGKRRREREKRKRKRKI